MDYLDITSAVISVSRKCWVRKYLSHNVSKLTVGVSIGKIYYILFMPVSYHMVLDLNILSALCRHKVRGHLDAGFIRKSVRFLPMLYIPVHERPKFTRSGTCYIYPFMNPQNSPVHEPPKFTHS